MDNPINPNYTLNAQGWLLYRMIEAGSEAQVAESLKSVPSVDIASIRRDAVKLAELCTSEQQGRIGEPEETP